MAELCALFLAGLSLFFHGVSGVRSHLQGLTSRRLRQQLARWARHPLLAGASGFLFGAVTQSSTAVAFIVASLVSSGLMTVARALPIVAWANLGTVLLVLFVSFDVHLAFLYVLGLTGLALAFELGNGRMRTWMAALFCVGLLFFGLNLMKEAFAPLPGFVWFKDLAAFLQGSTFAAFVAGALLRLLIQSSSAISVLAIALSHSGLFSEDQAAMIMYGTGAGVGLSVFLLSSNLRGVLRQIALFQAANNSFAALALASLFYIEHFTGWPLLHHLAGTWVGDPDLRLACSYLFLQSTSVLVALLSARAAVGWLEKWSPPTDEQDLSRPRYLTDQALNDPEAALDLAEKEQLHLFARLPAQLDTVRAETAATAPVSAETRHRATLAVSAEIEGFLAELVEHQTDRVTSQRLLALERRQNLIRALHETTFDFVSTLARLHDESGAPDLFVDNLAESFNTLLLSALDALASGDPADCELLLRLTSDRGELMERLRRNLLAGPQALDHQRKTHLFYLTTLFERGIWLLRQVGLLQQSLDRAPVADTQS
jgi:phosphate:Na+ symporter